MRDFLIGDGDSRLEYILGDLRFCRYRKTPISSLDDIDSLNVIASKRHPNIFWGIPVARLKNAKKSLVIFQRCVCFHQVEFFQLESSF